MHAMTGSDDGNNCGTRDHGCECMYGTDRGTVNAMWQRTLCRGRRAARCVDFIAREDLARIAGDADYGFALLGSRSCTM